ncbi:3 3' [Octopus vulgaris]|uniref:Phosphodiesterase n=2 Tax=Octopus vulgaris TaxID=6645 RepID=A0AA36B3E7_OCTVU|nr:3 3' [Octopus vulgaris]
MSFQNHQFKNSKLPPLHSFPSPSLKSACLAPFSTKSPAESHQPEVGIKMVVRGRSPLQTEWKKENMIKFLNENPEFLDSYVYSKVNIQRIEEWYQQKTKNTCHKMNRKEKMYVNRCTTWEPDSMKWKFNLYKNKDQQAQKLISELVQIRNKTDLLIELTNCLVAVNGADGANLYIPDCNNEQEVQFSSRKSLVDETLFSVMTVPICDEIGHLISIIDIYRLGENLMFEMEDKHLAYCFRIWASVLLKNIEIGTQMEHQRQLNDFILTVTRSIFSDMSMDTIIIKIMSSAKTLTNADRASLFLVDMQRKELFSRIFDAGSDPEKYMSNDIRFSINKGVAGYVASTGEILNIPDAYQDSRFNRDVDQKTGYITKTILCMPIFIRGKVIGVVQMVNKLNGVFTKDDEEAFEAFAVYCGLALHHAKIYDKIRQSEQKFKVALEVLSYHNQCTEDEYQQVKSMIDSCCLLELSDVNFNPWSIDNTEKVVYVLQMGQEIFGDYRLNMDNFTRFVLTVRKNYRNVPYHNWTHAFSVTQTMFTILKKSGHEFETKESIALFIACLCHDLDHRGKTNQFMKLSESPLAALYTTSTMEHHHFNQTVTILQNEKQNIFSNLTTEEYKEILKIMKECILATDLALFFGNRDKLRKIVDDSAFIWEDKEHRKLLRSITMTGADLCASAKPWDIQKETVKVVFEEFYAQGDEEKAHGSEPMPMMDREKRNILPETQVGFLSFICLPCYQLMSDLLPETTTMVNGVKKNLENWEILAKECKTNEETETR